MHEYETGKTVTPNLGTDEVYYSWMIGTSLISCNDDGSGVSEVVFSRRHASRQKFSSFATGLIRLLALIVLISLEVRLIDNDSEEHDGWQAESWHCEATEV